MDPVVHLELLAHNARIAAEGFLPIAVTQHQHGLGADLVLALAESTTQMRVHAQHVEEVRRHDSGLNPLRLAPTQKREPHRMVLHHSVQGFGVVPVVEDLLGREVHVLNTGPRRALTQEHQILTLAVRQRLEKNPVDHAEDRRVRTDSQSEGQNGHQGEHRAAPQGSESETRVLKDRSDELPTAEPLQPLLVQILTLGSDLFHIPEASQDFRARLIFAHPTLDQLIDAFLDVKAELLVHVLFDSASGALESE